MKLLSEAGTLAFPRQSRYTLFMTKDELLEEISRLDEEPGYYVVGSVVGYAHDIHKKFRRLLKDPLMLPALLDWDVDITYTLDVYAAKIEAMSMRRSFGGRFSPEDNNTSTKSNL